MKQQRPQWKRTAISSAVALAIASFQTPVWATCPGTVSGTETTACTLTGTESVTITTGNALEVAGATALTVDNAATGVTVTNSGTIAAQTIGINLQLGNTGTTIDNLLGGVIRADSDSDLTGIYVNGAFDGSLTNAGSIQANTLTGVPSVTAFGIEISGALTGSVSNSGSINASGISTANDADIYGIFINDAVTSTGSITNSGDINVDASASDTALAYGMYIGTDLDGSLTNTNTGTINVTATVGTYVSDAVGINLIGDISASGDLTNAGTIDVTVLATNAAASVSGLFVGGSVAGTLLNSGDITVDVTNGGNSDTVFGLNIVGDVTGSVTNTGNVTVDHHVGTLSSTSATGLRINGTLSGTLDNQGTISVNMDVQAGGNGIEAEGVHVSTLTTGGQFLNSDTIEATATAVDTSAYAAGIHLYDMNGGALTNSGTITATAIAPSDSASAEGISIISLTGGTFLNNGTITATASGGTNSYAGGIFVGTLDGSITNSGAISGTATNQADGYSLYLTGGTGTVNNQAGGVLNGNLFADGTISVANAGRIELPANAAALIGGNYTQSGNGVLELGVVSDTNYASLTVSGTADFSASSRLYVNVDNANTLAQGNALLNVISAGSLTATAFNVTDNYALWNFTAAIDGNTVDLTVIPGLTILEAAQMGGASSAAFGVAGTLDAINAGTPSSDMNTVLASLNGMTEAEIAAATEQLMPAISGGVGHLTNQIAGVLPDAVDERLNSKRGLSSGDSPMSDHKAWVKPFGNWTDQDDRKGVFGYEADSYGIALGTDADSGAGWRVGAAFAYSNSDVESKATNYRHQIDMDTYQIGVYGSHQIDADTALDLKAAWGMSSYDSSRRVDFLTPIRVANADYDSWHLRLNAKLSHQYAMDAATSVAPYLRADYVYVDVDSYRENGAGALDLNVNSDTEDAFILGVGADVDHTVNDNLTLKANLGVGYDISSDQSSLDASFVNDGAVFSTKGLDPDPLILRAGVGAVFANIKNVEITGRYDIEARQDYKNQGVSVNLGWKF